MVAQACRRISFVHFLQDCDPALLRRFSRRIEVPLPDSTAREEFFQYMLSRPELDSHLSAEDISTLVRLTQGYSGSDLADLCRTAALVPVRELMRQQRQQLGHKRRRVGSNLGLPSSMRCNSRESDASCVVGSPHDRTADVKGLSATRHRQANLQVVAASVERGVSASFIGEDSAEGQPIAQADEVQLRALVLADFKAALELVKPAAVDASIAPA
jgi:SpoVK/Ycf46/Vps4 family AAA+-type ATPase